MEIVIRRKVATHEPELDAATAVTLPLAAVAVPDLLSSVHSFTAESKRAKSKAESIPTHAPSVALADPLTAPAQRP